jgi:rod shape-determining protein MreC
MESLFNRFRSLTVLLLALFAQLVLVAYQVKTSQDVPLIRVWAVSAVTPLARLLEAGRTNTIRFAEDYFVLAGARQENRRLAAELDRLKIENRFLRSELGTADRVQALSLLQQRTPSRTVAARVIGTGPGANSRVIFADRGSLDGVKVGMAAVNADGLIGKVIASYPTASQIMLVTDPGFAAGVISSKNRVQGTLKGEGLPQCRIDYLQNEEKVEAGEWFYTSGEDRIFPRGVPVGRVTSVGAGSPFKDVLLAPSGLARGVEEVLIVLEGVHQPIPEPPASVGVAPLLPPPAAAQPETTAPDPSGGPAVPATEADRVLEQYKKSAATQGRAYGDNNASSVPPAKPPVAPAPRPAKPAPVKP